MAMTEATRPSFWVQPAPAISSWQLAGNPAISNWHLAVSQTETNPKNRLSALSSVFLRVLCGKGVFSASPYFSGEIGGQP
jgi:hypothetical protein